MKFSLNLPVNILSFGQNHYPVKTNHFKSFRSSSIHAEHDAINRLKPLQHKKHLQQIIAYAQEKKSLTNQDVRDLVHVSQTTATDYLKTLVNKGVLRKDKKAKAKEEGMHKRIAPSAEHKTGAGEQGLK